MFNFFKKLFSKKNNEIETCNVEVWILDIRNNYIYTMDGNTLTILKIETINTSLLTNKEKVNLINELSSNLADENEEMKFYIMPSAIDITKFQENILEISENVNDPIRKRLLREELQDMQIRSLNGEICKKQCFLIIYKKTDDNCEKELLKRSIALEQKFSNCGIKLELLDETELIRVCNSFLNMNYATRENELDMEERIPKIAFKEVASWKRKNWQE